MNDLAWRTIFFLGKLTFSGHYFVCNRVLANVASIPEYEYNSLYDLHSATHGDTWHWFNDTTGSIPWNFSTSANPCTDNWQGVNCSIIADQYHISELTLPLHNLRGSLPSSIGQLGETIVFFCIKSTHQLTIGFILFYFCKVNCGDSICMIIKDYLERYQAQ